MHRRCLPGSRLRSVLACAGLVVVCGVVARAQGAPQSTPPPSASAQASADPSLPAGISTAEMPDVQIVAMPNPISPGQWVVTAAYPTVVDHAKATARVQGLAAATGWTVSALRVEDRALQAGVDNAVLTRHHMGSLTPPPPMTSVTFSTVGALADRKQGTLAIEPFIHAYGDLSRLHVLFLVPGGFSYQGPHSYSDPKLDLAVAGGTGGYMYVVVIRNHDLRDLQLPKTEAERQQALAAADEGRTDRSHRAGVALVFVIALVAAIGVYLGVRYSAPRAG